MLESCFEFRDLRWEKEKDRGFKANLDRKGEINELRHDGKHAKRASDMQVCVFTYGRRTLQQHLVRERGEGYIIHVNSSYLPQNYMRLYQFMRVVQAIWF